MVRPVTFLMLFGISLVLASPAKADERYLTGKDAEKKLADEYSIHFEAPDYSAQVGCYRETGRKVRKGKHPLCWANDQRSIPAMSISIFIGSSDTADEKRQRRALRQVFRSEDYKLEGLGEKELLSDMVATHYQVSFPYSSYTPYISVVQFPVGEKKVLAVFFNGNASQTGYFATPIREDVEAYLKKGMLGPVKK